MASDVNSPLLGLLLQATGNNSNTWGDKLNTSTITVLENAVAGCSQISTTGGATTLTETQRVNASILLTGTLASDATFTIATNVSKLWVVQNNCTLAGHVVKFKTTSGSATTVPAGLHIMMCDGNNNIAVL